jgi:hypothetical protein
MIFKTLPILKRYGPWVLAIFVALFLINCMEVLSYHIHSLTPALIALSLLSMMSLLIRSALLSQESFVKFLYLMGASHKQVAYHFHKETLYLCALGTVIGLVFATPIILIKPYEPRILLISFIGLCFLVFAAIAVSRWTILRYLGRLYERLY